VVLVQPASPAHYYNFPFVFFSHASRLLRFRIIRQKHLFLSAISELWLLPWQVY
jgi:hypothetical protein